MPFIRKYNVTLDGSTAGSLKIRRQVRKAGSNDFAVSADWTPAAGDVKVSKDGGATANIGTLPSYSNGAWEFVLSGTELSAKSITVVVTDSATKAVDDDELTVETFGNASAMWATDYTAANLPADVKAILGTLLTETAGQIAAAFKQFFNVGSPTGTVNSLADAGVTTARMGYIDNLNVGGPVASHADILAINQSASKHLLIQTVGQYERPESGSTVYTVEARTFSASTGAAVNADSTPTLTATGQTSGSLSANLGAATNPATGLYRWTYTVANNATIEPIRFDVSATIASATFTLSAYTQVADFVAATFTTADRTALNGIVNSLGAWTGSGINTVLGAFRALVNKLAGLTPTDLTAGGGGFNNTTDSTEAIRDRGDVAWTTGGSTSLAAGSVVSTTGTTTTLDTGAVATASYYNDESLVIVTGPGAGQERPITAYSSGRVATHAAWVTNPDATSTYQIRAARSTAVASGGGIPGAGASPCTQTIGSPAVPDAEVWVSTDPAGLNVFAGTLVTNGQGKVTFLLNPGATYYLWAQKENFNPILGSQFIAVAD